MKLTEENFQTAVKIGGLVLMLSTVGNVYFLLRHREVYRDASRIEAESQQRGALLTLQQSALENILRDFQSRASNDPGIAAVFQRRKEAMETKPTAPAE